MAAKASSLKWVLTANKGFCLLVRSSEPEFWQNGAFFHLRRRHLSGDHGVCALVHLFAWVLGCGHLQTHTHTPPPSPSLANDKTPDLAWYKFGLKIFSSVVSTSTQLPTAHPPTQNEITLDLVWCKFRPKILCLGLPAHPTLPPKWDLAWYQFRFKFFYWDYLPTHLKWDNIRFGLI